MQIKVDVSDLQKVLDALTEAKVFLIKRDEMNAYVHLAKEVRYSPLTSLVVSEQERLIALIDEREGE